MSGREPRSDTTAFRAGGLRHAVGLLILLAGTLVGCAEPQRGPWEPRAPTEMTLEVRNDNYLDVAIYALTDGQHLRLGSVTGKSRATLQIPAAAVVRADGFRLEVDPVGSRDTYVSERIVANPGATVVLEVGSVLDLSSWHLR